MLLLLLVAMSYVHGRIRSSDPQVVVADENLINLNLLPQIPLGEPNSIETDIPGPPLSPDDFSTAITIDEQPVDTTRQRDPIEIAGLYQGDIIVRNKTELLKYVSDYPRFRNAIKDHSRVWPNGIIPYVISSTYETRERGVIAMAMKQYQNQTCIKFVPRTPVHKDYIHILKGDGCSSSVGRAGGAQAVSIGPGCIYVGIVMHELMHAAGFWHEQSRYDRDNYITINLPNVQPGMEYNFDKYSWDVIQSLGAQYDTGSIMHYGPYAFARDRTKPTIIPNNNEEIGQRRGFSQIDVQKLRSLYECNGGDKTTVVTEKPITGITTDKCEDSNKYCQTWADMGECESNPSWMKVNCKKACKECGKACRDMNSFCGYWAEKGECTTNPEYMHVFCKKSCGLCHSPSDLNAECSDQNKHCSAWAADRQCKANPSYMLIYCKKSCKAC